MKLWEIKAQALRLMFADYDMQFDEEEFQERIVYDNPNTRDKLIRMDDSIRRAIDIYYNVVGDVSTIWNFSLDFENGEFLNSIDLNQKEDIYYPTRVDLVMRDANGYQLFRNNQINFYYDTTQNLITFNQEDYRSFGERVMFIVYYKKQRATIPIIVDEIDFDLDSIGIRSDVQNLIPYYIKGELYEEDEPNIAAEAKGYYIQSLSRLRKQFSNVRTKVRRSKVFDQRYR